MNQMILPALLCYDIYVLYLYMDHPVLKVMIGSLLQGSMLASSMMYDEHSNFDWICKYKYKSIYLSTHVMHSYLIVNLLNSLSKKKKSIELAPTILGGLVTSRWNQITLISKTK